MSVLPSERQLAIQGFTEQWWTAVNDHDRAQARWLEKCLGDLETMSDEEFAERYKDIEEI
jgi:hypothetical protein